MIWLARALRLGLIIACGFVLSGLIPISLTHFRGGTACPMIGAPMIGAIPACYVVSVAYSAMALAAIIWWRVALWLFLLGTIPVISLAAMGTTAELSGVPTCPRSAGGLPLCYASLAIGTSLLVTFLVIRWVEKKHSLSAV